MKIHVFNSDGNLFKQLGLYYVIVLINILISWQVFNVIFFRAQLSFFLGYFMWLSQCLFLTFLFKNTWFSNDLCTISKRNTYPFETQNKIC